MLLPRGVASALPIAAAKPSRFRRRHTASCAGTHFAGTNLRARAAEPARRASHGAPTARPSTARRPGTSKSVRYQIAAQPGLTLGLVRCCSRTLCAAGDEPDGRSSRQRAARPARMAAYIDRHARCASAGTFVGGGALTAASAPGRGMGRALPRGAGAMGDVAGGGGGGGGGRARQPMIYDECGLPASAARGPATTACTAASARRTAPPGRSRAARRSSTTQPRGAGDGRGRTRD